MNINAGVGGVDRCQPGRDGGKIRKTSRTPKIVAMDAERIAETFVELADTLVDEFDVLDLLHVLSSRCVELLDVDAAAILLANPAGRLTPMVATSREARLLDRFQLDREDGPGLDCFRIGSAVAVERLDEADSRWPGFAREATACGFRSVMALPMRMREDTIGVLSLLAGPGTGPMAVREAGVGQAMADAATLAILQYRLTEDLRVTNEQLQRALDSRVLIEQGKGVLATRLQVSEDEAFRLLRERARTTRRRLTEVADEVRHRGPDTDWNDYRHTQPRTPDYGDG